MRATTDSEKGQIALVMAAILMVAAAVALGVVRLGVAADGRARAQAAADAAALAGASGGHEAAQRLAEQNRSVLVRYNESGDDVIVEVRRGEHRAEARARRVVVPVPDHPIVGEPNVEGSP